MTNKTETLGLILLLLLSIVMSMSSVSADDWVVEPSWTYQVGNENYTVSSSMGFSQIIYNESWIKFNTTDFNISSSNPINLSLSYLNSNPLTANAGDTILSFSANASGGVVSFNISGFSPSTVYTLYRDDATVNTYTTDSGGYLNFTNDVWSDHDFDVKEGDQTGSRIVQINYEHDLLGTTYTRGVDTIGLFSLIMIFAALGAGFMFLMMIKGGRN